MSTPAPLDRGELAAWLRLLETPGIGRISARRLIARFGSPEEVFQARPAAWQAVLDAAKVQSLQQAPAHLAPLTASVWQWLEEHPQRAVVALGDPRYPAALLALPDPPLLLYAEGRLDLLAAPALAVVGSRNPSAQGTENARAFARDLSNAGLTVVSGLALGIDGAAHAGALEGPAGTVAVVGTGLDATYPTRHKALARRIAEEGLLLSEFTLGTPPKAEHFPQRNRIIAALGLGTLVVEAALQSGSLITARLALDCGREVYAIPGSIHAAQSRGCHALIKQGAKLVESTQDILDELPLSLGTAPQAAEAFVGMPIAESVAASEAHAESTDPILQALGHGPASFDTLQLRTGWGADQLNVRLLDLELAGQVERLPGQIFQRLVRA